MAIEKVILGEKAYERDTETGDVLRIVSIKKIPLDSTYWKSQKLVRQTYNKLIESIDAEFEEFHHSKRWEDVEDLPAHEDEAKAIGAEAKEEKASEL